MKLHALFAYIGLHGLAWGLHGLCICKLQYLHGSLHSAGGAAWIIAWYLHDCMVYLHGICMGLHAYAGAMQARETASRHAHSCARPDRGGLSDLHGTCICMQLPCKYHTNTGLASCKYHARKSCSDFRDMQVHMQARPCKSMQARCKSRASSCRRMSGTKSLPVLPNVKKR